MSDKWIRLVPRTPSYQPTESQEKEARLLLAEFFQYAQAIESRHLATIEAFHPVENWEGVYCPFCESELSEAWWSEAMNASYQSGFTQLTCKTACCHKETTLTELQYPYGFALGKFYLEAMNAIPCQLTAAQILQIEKAIGCRVHQVLVKL